MDLSAAMFVLLRAAVRNPVNRYFVLLSEACVPLYPAAALYLQVVHEPRSRINGAMPRCRAPTCHLQPLGSVSWMQWPAHLAT